MNSWPHSRHTRVLPAYSTAWTSFDAIRRRRHDAQVLVRSAKPDRVPASSVGLRPWIRPRYLVDNVARIHESATVGKPPGAAPSSHNRGPLTRRCPVDIRAHGERNPQLNVAPGRAAARTPHQAHGARCLPTTTTVPLLRGRREEPWEPGADFCAILRRLSGAHYDCGAVA